MTTVVETHVGPSVHSPPLGLNWKISKPQLLKGLRRVFSSVIVKPRGTFSGHAELMVHRLTPIWYFLFEIELRSDCAMLARKIKATSYLTHLLADLLSYNLYTTDGRKLRTLWTVQENIYGPGHFTFHK